MNADLTTPDPKWLTDLRRDMRSRILKLRASAPTDALIEAAASLAETRIRPLQNKVAELERDLAALNSGRRYLPLSEVTDGLVRVYRRAYEDAMRGGPGVTHDECVRAGLAAIQWPSVGYVDSLGGLEAKVQAMWDDTKDEAESGLLRLKDAGAIAERHMLRLASAKAAPYSEEEPRPIPASDYWREGEESLQEWRDRAGHKYPTRSAFEMRGPGISMKTPLRRDFGQGYVGPLATSHPSPAAREVAANEWPLWSEVAEPDLEIVVENSQGRQYRRVQSGWYRLGPLAAESNHFTWKNVCLAHGPFQEVARPQTSPEIREVPPGETRPGDMVTIVGEVVYRTGNRLSVAVDGAVMNISLTVEDAGKTDDVTVTRPVSEPLDPAAALSALVAALKDPDVHAITAADGVRSAWAEALRTLDGQAPS